MIVLPAALRETVRKIGAGKPYAWLFAIAADEDYATETGTAFYLTTYDQPISFANLLPLPVASRTYQPMSLQVGTVSVNTDVGSPSLQVACSNAFGEVSFRMDTGKGFMGCACAYVVVNVDQLADGAIMSGEGRVRGVALNGTTASFTVELYGLASLTVPQNIFIVDRCRYLYGDESCGFPLDLVNGGSHPTYLKCSKTFAECKARGLFESTTLNRPKRHPMRFGGFLGLPRLARR